MQGLKEFWQALIYRLLKWDSGLIETENSLTLKT
jgi:hypothetical protein